MALLLKSSKLICTAVGVAGKINLATTRKKIFTQCSRVASFNGLQTRSATSVAAKEVIREGEYDDSVHKSLQQLSFDIRTSTILLSNVNSVFNELKEQGQINGAQLIVLLQSCSESAFFAKNEGRISLAKQIWNTAEKLGTEFNISHYNVLASVFLDNEHKFNPEDFLKNLEEKNIKPNRTTFKLLLKAYGQQGNIEGARQILMQMKELNHPLGEEEFNSLIQGHCERGDFEKAIELLNVMKTRDLTPTSSSYSELLFGYAKFGKTKELDELLDTLPQKNISINNPILMEIIYKLAKNNHEQHIDSIIKRLNPEDEMSFCSAKLVQKLLKDGKDSMALKIFEHSLSSGITEENKVDRASSIIKHFVMHRSQQEILDICKVIQEKGWSRDPMTFALREVLLTKNDIDALKFLNTMKDNKMEIREHYYWPVVINSSKKGTGQMRKILKRLPRSVFRGSIDFPYRIIIPNYSFKKDWKSDIEFLLGLGIERGLLHFCMLEKMLKEQRIQEAEEIISKERVFCAQLPQLVTSWKDALLAKPENFESLMTILNYLSLDCYYQRKVLQLGVDFEGQRVDEDVEVVKLFDQVISIMLKPPIHEDVITQLLENMLKRKMKISTEAAASLSSLKNEKVTDLANKLTDTELKFEPDINALALRLWKIPNENFSKISDRTKNLVVEHLNNPNKLLQELGSDVNVTDKIFVAIALLRCKKFTTALGMLQDLADQKTDLKASTDAVSLFENFFFTAVLEYGQDILTLTDLACGLGLENDLSRLLKAAILSITRLNLKSAVECYCKLAQQKGETFGLMNLLAKAAKDRNDTAIEKLKTASSGLIDQEQLSFYLVIAYTSAGELEKARELLPSVKLHLKEKAFHTSCGIIFNSVDSQAYEHCLTLLESFPAIDSIPVVKLLFRKYAAENKVNKALQFCETLLENRISNYSLLQELSAFRENPTSEKLKKLAVSIDNRHPKFPEMNIQRDVWRRPHVVDEAAAKGDVFEVLKLLQTHRANVAMVGASFLGGKKIQEFFQFLDHFIVAKKFNAVTGCFSLKNLAPFLNDDAHFQQYKTLAIRCLEEGYRTLPIISLFVQCLKLPGRLPAAEELIEQYSNQFKNIPFFEINQAMNSLVDDMDVQKNFLTSKTLKNFFFDHLHSFYNQLIKFHREKGDLESAIKYLDMAVADKVEKNVDKTLIQKLEEELRKSGKTFPYSQLSSAS